MSTHRRFSFFISRITFALLSSVCLLPADSHRPAITRSSCDSDYVSSASALPIPDPSISWSFKHYLDCTGRAVWMKFTNPKASFKFYVGVGVPPMPRFAGLRADAVIIGPGLPKLSASDMASLPTAVRNDPVWNGNGGNVGAYIHRSPQDQSTCAHLGTVMSRNSMIRNGRCDFHEPYGDTHSWRVLDADDNNIPQQGQEYYVAVWLQEHQSGKIGIAFGTWREDFRTPYTVATPTCTRDMSDFSEKRGDQTSSFPVSACASDGASVSPTGANIDLSLNTPGCDHGKVCACPTCGDCASMNYDVKMGCGGERCPHAAKSWDDVNMKMHNGMAINFTGNARVDFVRSMIPHHQGAVDMCELLVLNLSCKTWEDIGDLDGLIHFCNHVNLEQKRELAGMHQWLETAQLQASASCMSMSMPSMNSMGGMNGMHNGGMNGMHSMHTMHNGHQMSDGCGNTSSPSSQQYIEVNRQMHAGMAINFSCAHSIDFVRGMIPHHAGAVAMCQILEEHMQAEPDAYLSELCANITRLQRAEITWLSTWLVNRGHPVVSSCESCVKVTQPALPCEDILPATSFCHLLGGDLLCKCESAVEQYPCGTLHEVPGFADLNTSAECQRTCGLCPVEHSPLFHNASCSHDHMHHGHDMTNGNGMTTTGEENSPSSSSVHRSCLSHLLPSLGFATLWFL